MKACIEIPGHIGHGLWSPERGESRWAQNWARFLAEEKGFQVDCVANPGWWGDCPRVQNVNFIGRVNPSIEYDFYMNSCWWPGRDIGNVKSKIYVHFTFSFEDSLADPNHVKENHVITYPFLKSRSRFIHEKNIYPEKTFPLAAPLGRSYGESRFDNNKISFTAKEVFLGRHEGGEEYWFDAGVNTIKAIIEMANKYGMDINFCVANELNRRCPQGGGIVSRLGIEELVESAPRRTMYELVPLGKLLDIIRESKILTPVISTGGSMIEGVVEGVMSLCWAGSIFDEIARGYDFLLQHNASYEEIRNNMDRLLSDKKFYNDILKDCQLELKGHLYEESHKQFDAIIDWGKAEGYLQ